MSKSVRTVAPKPATAGARLESATLSSGRPEFGVSGELPALSVCRLEAREELLRKLRQHVDDPALADYTCPICWDPFWQPVRTVCGHAFCEACLLKTVLTQLGQAKPDVSCPLCRYPLHVDDVAVDQALLTRMRLVLTERCREQEGGSSASSPRRQSGRLQRGRIQAPGGTGKRPSTAANDESHLEGLAVTTGPAPPQVSVNRTHRPMLLPRPSRTAPAVSQSSLDGLDGFDGDMPLLAGWVRVAPSQASSAPPSTAPATCRGSLKLGTPARPVTAARPLTAAAPIACAPTPPSPTRPVTSAGPSCPAPAPPPGRPVTAASGSAAPAPPAARPGTAAAPSPGSFSSPARGKASCGSDASDPWAVRGRPPTSDGNRLVARSVRQPCTGSVAMGQRRSHGFDGVNAASGIQEAISLNLDIRGGVGSTDSDSAATFARRCGWGTGVSSLSQQNGQRSQTAGNAPRFSVDKDAVEGLGQMQPHATPPLQQLMVALELSQGNPQGLAYGSSALSNVASSALTGNLANSRASDVFVGGGVGLGATAPPAFALGGICGSSLIGATSVSSRSNNAAGSRGHVGGGDLGVSLEVVTEPTSYAADFAFANRYRKLLEEGA